MKQIKSINILKQNKGATLIWVLIVFVVLTILTASVAFVSRQNIFEVAKQEERLQTYYIALAGIELTYAALMELNGSNAGIDDAILNKIGTGSASQKINIKFEGETEKRGIANVTIDRTIEKDPETKEEINWLRITSVGELKDKTVTVPSIMRINEKNVNQIIRER